MRRRSTVKFVSNHQQVDVLLREQRSNLSKILGRISSDCRSKICLCYGLNQPPWLLCSRYVKIITVQIPF